MPWSVWGRGIAEIIRKYDPELLQTFPGWYDLMSNELIKKHGDKARNDIVDFWVNFEEEYLTGYDKNPELINFIKNNGKGKSRYTFSLWTSNCLPTVEKVLGELGILDYFETIATRDKVNLIKPEVDGFELINSAKNFEKSDYLMIGDSQHDKNAAKNTGIDFFGINFFKL